MITKIYFSKVSDCLSGLSLIKGGRETAFAHIAETFCDDMAKAAEEGCGIYYSNALCQFSDCLGTRFCVADVKTLIAEVRNELLLKNASLPDGMLVILGCKDIDGAESVIVIWSGEIVLETSDFADAHVHVQSSEKSDCFTISFVPVSGIMSFIGEISSSEAVFAVGSLPEYSTIASDIRSEFMSISKEIGATIFFAQEKAHLSVDDDVFDELSLSCNYYEPNGDSQGYVDFDGNSYQKMLFTSCCSAQPQDNASQDGCSTCDCHQTPVVFLQDAILKREKTVSSKAEKDYLPLCDMDGSDGLLGAFRSVALNLANKARMIGSKKLVLGLSGGIDSAAALLACLEAVKILKWKSEEIVCVSMPCFGSSKCTQDNAAALSKHYKTSFMRIPIADTVLSHFKDIGHGPDTFDKAFENAQARMRAVTLFDLANMLSGLQVGTADLSESILGWCTFQGDQAAMFNANIGFSKTQLKEILRHYAKKDKAEAILSILDTPISPELLPLSSDGGIVQKSEDSVGPYEVVDCFIYYYFCKGYDLKKTADHVATAYCRKYSTQDIGKWCASAHRAYYASSFKRLTSMPGPRTTKVSRMISKLAEYSAFPL